MMTGSVKKRRRTPAQSSSVEATSPPTPGSASSRRSSRRTDKREKSSSIDEEKERQAMGPIRFFKDMDDSFDLCVGWGDVSPLQLVWGSQTRYPVDIRKENVKPIQLCDLEKVRFVM